MVVKLFLKPSLSKHEVIKDVIILSDGFVWGTPTSTDKVEVSTLDQVSHLQLDVLWLLLIPLFEVFDFSISEGEVLVINHLANN